MRIRSIVIAFGCGATLWAPTSAASLDLSWSGGRRDVSFAAARSCTLEVVANSPVEELPAEWRLIWRTEGGDQQPFTISSQGSARGVAAICTQAAPASLDDSLARMETAHFCSDPGGHVVVARYILGFQAAVRARFGIVIPPWIGALDVAVAVSQEVTTNGGPNAPLPPIVLAAGYTAAEGKIRFTCRGKFLDRVVGAGFLPDATNGTPIPLQVDSASDTLLQAHSTSPTGPKWALIELMDASGATAALTVPQTPASPSAGWPGDHLLVRFRSNQVEPRLEATGGNLDELDFAKPSMKASLANAGIVRLDRLFPSFTHADVHSRNFIGEPIELEDLADIYVAAIGSGFSADAARVSLSGLPGILTAEPDYVSRVASLTPNDPLFYAQKQWNLEQTGQVICNITAQQTPFGAVSAWNYSTGSPGVRVAILDTGADNTHSELLGRVQLGPTFVPGTSTSFDDDDDSLTGAPIVHGTAVTGIIAANTNNNNGMAGTAWNVTPWAVKVVQGGTHDSRVSWVGLGVDWARAQQFPIINMSLGFPEVACPGYGPPIGVDSANVLVAACRNAFYTGSFLCAWSGNCEGNIKEWPAAFAKGVYAVGALFLTGSRWRDYDISPQLCLSPPQCNGSSYGSWVDAIAPGGRLIVTLGPGPNSYKDIPANCRPNDYTTMLGAFGGTSASAALVSGLAALLKSQNWPYESGWPLLGEDIEHIINITGSSYSDPISGTSVIPIAAGALSYFSFFALRQGTLGPNGTFGGLTVVATDYLTNRVFNDVPGLPANGAYNCWRYRLRGTANLGNAFSSAPNIWVRGSGTFGWRDVSPFNYKEEVNWGQLVGAPSAGSNTFETFVYRILDTNGNDIGWFPKPPEEATVAFTAWGFPSTTSVEDGDAPATLSILTYPNPVIGALHFKILLPQKGTARLEILDIMGRRVATLHDGLLPAGKSEFRWDVGTDGGGKAPAGVYFSRLQAGGRNTLRRFVVLGAAR